MSAKQRHKQRVVKRLNEKLELLSSMEENLHTVVRDHVQKAEKRCAEVLKLEDTGLFLNQYGKVEQLLDAAFNLVELLTSSAEDMIDSADQGDVVEEDQLECTRTSQEKNPKALTRQFSDTDIKKELEEMIQGSIRKRHGSSEAASQTVPEEDFVFDEQTVSKQDKVFCMAQSKHDTSAQQNTNRDTVCPKEQTVKNLKQSSDGSSHDSKNDFYETWVHKDTEQDISNENKDITGNKSKSKMKTSPKDKGRVKKDKIVPMNVRRHLNKDSVLDTDGSSSSQVDSVTFSQDVILASSPKKKKTSPKKKGGKMNLSTSAGNECKESERTNATKHKESVEKENIRTVGKDAINVKQQDIEKHSDRKVSDNNVTKSEPSEISSERTMASSEKSLLEHELDELRATESSEISTTSDVKSSSAEKQEVLTHHQDKKDSPLSKLHPGEKSVAQNQDSGNVKWEQIPENFDSANVDRTLREIDDASVLQESNANNSVLRSANLLAGKITPVIVSEVVSPWCFFVQKNDPELNKLMEQICIYMAHGGLAEPPLLEPEIGTLCLAKYSKDGGYYRAYVMQIHSASKNSDSEVSVLYVDYGNKEKVKVTQLRTLPDEFKTLPMQAICCALAEVMPCNKYCMWAEEDIHFFRQYVTGQQLGCTPPTCRSTGVALPLLVELIISLPVPIIPQGGIYLSQFSIAQLMVSAKKARQINVSEQLGLLAKSEEGAEEVAILSQNTVSSTLLAITELSESQCEPPKNVEADALNNELKPKVNRGLEQESLKVEQLDLKKDSDLSSAEVASARRNSSQITSDTRKPREHISPRSENSDTESQRDEGQRGTGKLHEKSQKGVQGTNSKAYLDRIKEEAIDLESCETVSTTTSLTTDFDFPPEKGIHLSDLHFDLDDLYFNPQGQEVMLAHVKSPGEFYVHVISQQSGETLDRLMKNLNGLFENANRRKLTKLSKTFQPEEKKLCCAQFLQDNNFYRGIIQSTKPENEIMKGRVLVHYIDFGDEEWLPRRRIFPLPSQFCSVPRLAIKCSLAYVKPVCDDKGEPVNKWSKKSVEKFIDIAGLEKTLHMHVVHGSIEDFKKSNPCEDSPILGILLVDNTGTEEVCVNMDLIREGVAELDTAQSKHGKGNTKEKSPDTRLEKWNPMEEDFFSKRNSYNIDIDDAGVATTGYKAKDEERICKFFSSGRDCWRGEQCPYRHILVESGRTYDQEPVYAVGDNQQEFLPQMGNWIAMEIATILSPCHFYAILPLGNKSLDTTSSESEKKETGAFGVSGNEETLDDLLEALNTEYSKRPAHAGNLLLRAIGEVVVARFSEDHNWYRARIIEVTEEKVKVFFVDFGNTEWLPEDEIADIKPEFLHLPFQAVECFMYVEPKSDDKWTQESKLAFRELVDGKMLVGYIKSRSWNGCLWVELYDTSTDDDINIKEELIEQGHALKAESQESHTDYSSNLSPASGEVLLVPG